MEVAEKLFKLIASKKVFGQGGSNPLLLEKQGERELTRYKEDDENSRKGISRKYSVIEKNKKQNVNIVKNIREKCWKIEKNECIILFRNLEKEYTN